MEDVFSKLCKERKPNEIKDFDKWINIIPGISYYPIIFKSWSRFSAFEISYAEGNSKKYNLYLVYNFGGDYSKVKLFKSSLKKCYHAAHNILKIISRLDIYFEASVNNNEIGNSETVYNVKSLQEEMKPRKVYETYEQ